MSYSGRVFLLHGRSREPTELPTFSWGLSRHLFSDPRKTGVTTDSDDIRQCGDLAAGSLADTEEPGDLGWELTGAVSHRSGMRAAASLTERPSSGKCGGHR